MACDVQAKATHPGRSLRLQIVGWLAIVLGSATAARAQDDQLHAFFADRIWTGEGAPIDEGVLLVRDGMVAAVGRVDELVLPATVHRHDLGPGVVVPGFVVAETGLLAGSVDSDEALTPDHRAWDGFDFFRDHRLLLAGGITTVQVSPGQRRLLPGEGAVVKLAGRRLSRRTLSERESLRIILTAASRNPPRIYRPPVGAVSVDRPLQPTQPQPARTLASAVATLRLIFASASRSAAAWESESRSLMEVVGDYLGTGRTVRVTVHEPAEIRAAITLAEEFDLRLLLVDPRRLRVFQDSYAGWKPIVRGVVLQPGVRPGQVLERPVPADDDPLPLPAWVHARRLLDAGLEVALRPEQDSDLGELMFLAGIMRRGGLSVSEALQIVTSSPARMLGVDHRVGTLATGKDADFLVLDGEPFATGTQVRATYVDGNAVYRARDEAPVAVLRVAEIRAGNGKVYHDAALAVREGKIVGIGRRVSAPPGSAELNFPDAVAVPGFVDLGTGLGLGGPLTGDISLSTRLGEQLYADDPAHRMARQSGVTTVLLTPGGTRPGPVVAFKLGERITLLRDPVAIRFVIAGNVTSSVTGIRRALQQGKAYAESWRVYDEKLAAYQTALKEYEAALARYEEAKKKAEAEKKSEEKEPTEGAENGGQKESKKESNADEVKQPEAQKKPEAQTKDAAAAGEEKPPEKPKEPSRPRENASLEPYRKLFAADIPALVVARRRPEIQAAVDLFRDEFKLPLILAGGDDTPDVATLLREQQVSVALGPTLVRRAKGQTINLPQRLANAGVLFGFQSNARTGVSTLPLAVQYAVHHGLGNLDALDSLTRIPAELLSLSERVGSLDVGKDADLVLLSGPPFELSTRVLAVMIDGQLVFRENDRDAPRSR